MKHLRLLLCASVLTPVFAFAEDAAEPEAEIKPLTIDAEVGALLTTGNTESSSFRGKLDTKQELEKWRFNYVAEAIYKKDRILDGANEEVDQVTAKRFFGSVQSDYKLNEEYRGLYVFGSYEKDEFSGFEYQGTVSAGYTDRLLKSERAEWNYSIGLGASFNKIEPYFDENGVFVEAESENFTIVRVSFDYRYDISDTAKFTQTFSSNVATDSQYNTQSKAESALTANLNQSFALRATLLILNNTDVPDGIENTDTQTGLAIVYSY